jgi:hypothetical protein
MKKKQAKKLQLERETLIRLEAGKLRDVAGGYVPSILFTECYTDCDCPFHG